jgi:hypothetical protein
MATVFQSGSSIKDQFVEALQAFKQKARLSSSEESDFAMTSLDDLKNVVRQMEQEQERKRRMVNMKRLEPFLKSMEEYGKIVEIFVNVSEVVAFVWVGLLSLFCSLPLFPLLPCVSISCLSWISFLSF